MSILRPWDEIEIPPYSEGGWNAFYKEVQKQYPIRFAISEWWDYTFKPVDRIMSVKYFIRNWFRRYDVIPTGLPRTQYCDPDYMMLHAMFTLLEDFVKIDEEQGFVDWEESSDKHAAAREEMDTLCEWWREYKNNDDFNIDTKERFEIELEMSTRLMKIRPFMWT